MLLVVVSLRRLLSRLDAVVAALVVSAVLSSSFVVVHVVHSTDSALTELAAALVLLVGLLGGSAQHLRVLQD